MRNQLFKYSLTAFACAQIFNSAIVLGQEDNSGEQSASEKKVVITGSRIKQVDTEGVSPVKTIGQDDIQESSANNLSDLLKELSITHGGEGSFSTHASGALQADAPVGAAAVSLRGLGASSTLVLINGRRVAGSSFAFQSQNFIDINSIPLAAVERVEILPSGASAIYGADAVAGVVNLILKDSAVDNELRISYGNSEAKSDDTVKNLSLVWGMSTDSTDINMFVDYYDVNSLYDRDRDLTANSFDPSQQGIWPSFNGQFFDDIDYVEATCPDSLRFDDRAGFPISSFGEYCQYNQNAFLPTYPALESAAAGFFSTTNINPNLRWFNEVYFTTTESSANSTGAPFSNVEVPFDHPNMPTELATRFNDLWSDLGVPPEDFLLMWGRFANPRTLQVTNENFRIVTGLEGNWENWDWNSSLNYSQNKAEQRGIAGIVNVEKFESALYGELCADGSIGCTPGVDGLYFNPFNGGLDNDQEIFDLIEENVPRNGESKLLVVDFNITGDLAELENGSLSAAFGAEFRNEEVIDSPSPLATADPVSGEVPVYGFGSTGARAERDVFAVYSEFLIPLAENFELQLAGRYDDYSDFGGDFNPKVGFLYRATDDFLIRGSWNTSFRAPSLAQVGADTTLSSGALECGPEFLNNFCGGFGGTDGYLSEIYGNPDLQAEESEAFDIGVAINFSQDAYMTLDYWAFEHDNIVGIDNEELFRAALRGDVAVVAEGDLAVGEIGIETRNGAIGDPIEEIHLQLENLGIQETSGIDFTYTQHWNANESRWSLLLDGTYLLDYDRQRSKQAEVEPLEGTFRYPELILRAKLRWRNDDWSTSLTGYYVSSYDDDLEKYTDDELSAFGISRNRKIPAWLEWRLSVGYEINQDAHLRLSIDNLLDEDAPLAYGTSANVDHFNHDTMGRFFRLTYTQNF
ncbi:TonB-dependent receptor [Aliikangiella marina]|uniref:TonB-dependent receptor n=1 Tax=Aliikangiella marina TaxID=1712262 RepID=A0A545TE40_9GAMM|nr:TonB-dependent receptor [Aliikangiella marina]TQV75488.1 TonB-dependent receptor [Aliikangiella marina]